MSKIINIKGKLLARNGIGFRTIDPIAPSDHAFPVGSGIFNVKTYGAVGDGVTDDTAAILLTINTARDARTYYHWSPPMVYLPEGTYRISDTLCNRKPPNNYYSNQLCLMGDGVGRTTILLGSNTAGFNDPINPKAVIYAASGLYIETPTGGGKDYYGKGEGNEAYQNYVQDLTVRVMDGNPGAIGIKFLGSNISAIRNVVVEDTANTALIGISLDIRWAGPMYVADTTVTGFDTGILVNYLFYCVTMQSITLSNQRTVALDNQNNVLNIRDLNITTSAIGIRNTDTRNLIVIDDYQFTPIGGSAQAIQNSAYLTIKTNGTQPELGSTYQNGGAFFGTTNLSPTYTAGWTFQNPNRAQFSDTLGISPTNWVSVAAFGAVPDGILPGGALTSDAIQRALDSGAEVIYFPPGQYILDKRLNVPDTVKYLHGMFSYFKRTNPTGPGWDITKGMFQVQGTSTEPLVISSMAFDNVGLGSQVAIELISPRPTLIRDVTITGTNILRQATGGELHSENVLGPQLIYGPAMAWLTSVNAEGASTLGLIRRYDGPLCILGYKTEQNGITIYNNNGAIELLGAFYYMTTQTASPQDLIVNEGTGTVYAAYAEYSYTPTAIYTTHIAQITNSVRTVALANTSLPLRETTTYPYARMNPGYSYSP